jgi:hypothetical protein
MSVVTSCLDLFRDSSFNVSVGILHRTLDPGGSWFARNGENK